MIQKEREGLQWFEFELLAGLPIVHACFTRIGGTSDGDLHSLNLGGSVGDHPENVRQNWTKVKDLMELKNLYSAKITHNALVTNVSGYSWFTLPISDGISTNSIGTSLAVTQADCQAAIFYDPVSHALANVHCGWRGNVQNIYREAVLHMEQTYGSKAANLLVCISPSLGPEHSQFVNYKTELPHSFLDFQIRSEYFDLWAIAHHQLTEAGVLSHHIQVSEIDTYSHPDFFSFRQSRKCGRQATVCALLPTEAPARL